MRRAGKARLYAFGFVAVAAVAGCDEKTVKRALRRGTLDMNSLENVLDWIVARQRRICTRAERQQCEPTLEPASGGATAALSALRSSVPQPSAPSAPGGSALSSP